MKKKKLIDLKLIATPPYYIYRRIGYDIEYMLQGLEQWVQEFHDFIRDHRSQDPVDLEIEKVYQETCEYCDLEWDLDIDGCPCCCDKAMDEWKLNKEIKFEEIGADDEEIKR